PTVGDVGWRVSGRDPRTGSRVNLGQRIPARGIGQPPGLRLDYFARLAWPPIFLLVSRKAFSLSDISVLPRETRLSPSATCFWPASTSSLLAALSFSPWATRSLPCFLCLLMSSTLSACCFARASSGLVLAQPSDRAATTETIPSVMCILFMCIPSSLVFAVR